MRLATKYPKAVLVFATPRIQGVPLTTRAPEDLLTRVRQHVKAHPPLTISRFITEAIQEALDLRSPKKGTDALQAK